MPLVIQGSEVHLLGLCYAAISLMGFPSLLPKTNMCSILSNYPVTTSLLGKAWASVLQQPNFEAYSPCPRTFFESYCQVLHLRM